MLLWLERHHSNGAVVLSLVAQGNALSEGKTHSCSRSVFLWLCRVDVSAVSPCLSTSVIVTVSANKSAGSLAAAESAGRLWLSYTNVCI